MARKSTFFIFLILFCAAGFSQSFRPDHLTGLQLWLRADSNVVLNGSNVSGWNDCSGNGYHSSQATAVNQPYLATALPELNNMPAVQFDGSNDFLTGTTIPNIHSTSFSIFIVAKNGVSGSILCMLTINGYSAGMSVAKHSTGQFAFYQNNNARLSGNITDCASTGTPFRIYTVTKNLNLITRMYVNSAFRTSNTSATITGPFINNNYVVGYDNITIKNWFGHIAEIIIYNSALADSNRIKVEQYLTGKYSPQLDLGADISVPYGFCDTTLSAGAGYTSYLWSTGDTTSGISVATEGEYWVEVVDGFGFTQRDTIIVSYPNTGLNAPDTLICAGDNLTLFIPGISLETYTFLWSTTATDSVINVQQAGEYWVKITDSLGCFSYSDTVHITVDSFSVFSSLGNDTAFCSGNEIILYHPGFAVNSYYWSDGSSDTALAVVATGNYWLDATDLNGCSLHDTIHVTISGQAPAADFSFDTVCLGDSTHFSDFSTVISPDSIVSWQWILGDGDTSFLNQPVHLYANAGSYYVTLTVTTNNGCSHSATRQLLVRNNPVAAFSAFTSCINIVQIFTDNSLPPAGDSIVAWYWDFGDGDTALTQNPAHAYDTAGIYQVLLIVTTDKGCQDDSLNEITIVAAAPSPSPVSLISPPDNYFSGISSILFSWNGDSTASGYALQLSDDSAFTAGVITIAVPDTTAVTTQITGSTSHWRVIAYNLCGDSSISVSRHITFFSPQILPGLKLWLRADSNVVLNGASVSQWSDCSGNAHDAVQNTPSARPALDTGIVSLNNMPALRFDGTDDLLPGDTIHGLDTTSLSIFIVADNQANNSRLCMFTANGYSGGITLAKGTSGNFAYYQKGQPLTSGNSLDCAITGSPFRIYAAVKDLDDSVSLFVNTALRSVATSPPDMIGTFANGNYRVGYDNSIIKYWDGHIAEIIIYDEALTDSNRTTIEQYLRFKYAPPVNLGPDIAIDYGFCDTILDAGARFSSFLWSTGDTTQTIALNQGGTYWVSVVDVFGFPSSDTVIVQKPTLQLHDTSLCIYTNAFINPALGSNYTYLWSDSSTNTTLTTAIDGQYWLTVYDTLGCSVSDTFIITVDSFAIQAGLGPDRAACRYELLGLASGAQQTVTYHWSDNTGNALMLINDAPGNYAEYSVTVTDINGCEARDTIVIFIKGVAPAAAFASDTVCAGDPTQFSDLSAPVAPEVITSWLWDFGDGDSSTQQHPLHIYSGYGVYNVMLTVSTDSGCFKTIVTPVTVWAYPEVSFAPVNGCSGIPVQFSDMSTNPLGTNASWWWDFGLPGNNDTSVAANPVFVYDSAGTYNVTLVVGSIGGCSDTLSSEINIRPSLMPDFVYSQNCFGETTNFQTTTIAPPYNPILKWHWDFGDSDTSGMVNPQHTFALPGSYTVTLSIFPLNGCSVSVQKQVNIYPRPHADFTAADLCIGQTGTFTDASTVNGDSIVQWLWTFPGGVNSTAQNPSYMPENTGVIEVSLIIITLNGCSDTTTKSITVHPLPEASFSMYPEFGPAPLTVEFNHTGTGSAAWQWIFGDGITSADENPQHTYVANGIYTVTLTSFNSFGCWDTVSGQVHVMFMDADIQVDRVLAGKSGNQLLIMADLTNLGMRPISQLYLSAQYNGSSIITETWEGLLKTGEMFQYTFNARFEMPSGVSPDYVCVRAAIADYDPDAHPENNEACAVMNDNFMVSDIYPNPTGNEVSADIIMPFDSDITIDLIDDMGRRVSRLFSGSLSRGLARLSFDVSDHADGVYAFRVWFSDRYETRKFLIIH